LIKEEVIVKYVKAQTIKWYGHLNKMEDIKFVKKITDWNPIGVRTKG
jgi:intein-encoded DNA endonuclease-like protein